MSISRNVLRTAALSVTAALALAATGPIASATEAANTRAAEHKAAAQVLTAVAEDADVPQIVEEGLEERLGALPQNPTTQQLVEAMYPGDEAAQKAALAQLAPQGAQSQGVQPQGVQLRGWDTAWKVTKCVGAIGAFIAGNALLVTKATKFGGVLKGAKLIVQAGNKEERIKLLVAIFGEVTGISTIATACG
ncbi:hypothetical protein GCM10009837_63900 [Streptomyces durmitorensis]|uniref:Secreted protein n=1 Tax=Streptomyces durmitorensis TaxID=319947 RepID=A0ABY4PVH4_9ACTN|nr:hypothetical protein [Streptomyces durmitorensis]UQT57057.1 hypothetical protein M4V62_19185 [Streptomyces durmitorensis]